MSHNKEEASMFRLAFALLCVITALGVPSLLIAQSPPPSDAQALTYAAQAVAALTGGTAINDVTLNGTAILSGPGTDTGTATLKALGTGESRMDLALTGGTRTEIRDSQTGIPIGQWANPVGTSGPFSYQSCQTDAVWFFPVLSSLANGQNVVLSYVGQEMRNDETVQHIRSYVYQPTPTVANSTQQFSTMDFYLDAATLLPVATMFNTYPDNGSAIALLIEIDFSNYQNVAGALVPMHIQRYLQGNLSLDVTITGVAFNTGIPLSEFSGNPAAAQ